MILAINIGNTHTTIALCGDKNNKNNTWEKIYRIVTKQSINVDEYILLLKKVLPHRYFVDCDVYIISSVVPSCTAMVVNAFAFLSSKKAMIIGDKGIKIPLCIPKEMGADLIANAVCAWTKSKQQKKKTHASITVDFGTAISITTVKGSGEIAGVSIIPGLSIALDTLVQNADKIILPKQKNNNYIGNKKNLHAFLKMPNTALGKTTQTAINGGITLGYKYLVCGLISHIKQELNEDVNVFATGGYAEFMAPYCKISHKKIFDEIDLYHTLEGLRIIACYNI